MSQSSKVKKKNSVSIFPLNLGGTNGPKLELDAIFTPPYNAARHGIRLSASPYQADVIILFGSATAKTADPALELLTSLPDDTRLLLLGSEATSAAPFARAYATLGPLLPTDSETTAAQPVESDEKSQQTGYSGLPLPPGKRIAAYVAGSPPEPQAIINAILQVAAL